MACALAPASAPPPHSYLTGASDLCVQDGLWSSDEQGEIRQDNGPRLHYPEAMDMDDQSQNGEEDDPPSQATDRTFGPSAARVDLLTIPALKSRILLMLAAAGGGPVASGLEAVLPRAGISHELISDVIAAVEKAFTEHGEKALRANCGGKLAKDESYGFLLADLVLGAIIPRDKAIALGEKMRKENKKIKTKRDGFRDGRSRALAKLPEGERAEAGADWDARRDAYLAGICEAELPIPELASAVAGVREQVKQEVKQEEVKREPAPPVPPPSRPRRRRSAICTTPQRRRGLPSKCARLSARRWSRELRSSSSPLSAAASPSLPLVPAAIRLCLLRGCRKRSGLLPPTRSTRGGMRSHRRARITGSSGASTAT